MFIQYNPEHLNGVINGCIPRALSCAYNKKVFYDEDIRKNWRKLLLNDNFTYVNIPAKPFKKRMTVKELAQNSNPNSLIICSTANHVVCIKNNNYYDTGDSGNMCVFYYFEKEDKVC